MLVLVFLAAGLAAGLAARRLPALLGAADRLSVASVCLLVFLLGLAVGGNPLVVGNLGSLGLRAAALGLAGVVGSAAGARLVASRLRSHAK